ncbi:type IV secretory system conjugative DNA transfer family protein [Clostridium botulinum]|uniref:hypothetical protein n=1 Tax=Clostridium botulinum TaxID=1491 RepID=UPI000AAAF082|nr:hypothetical protein [Clostridium botulinum]MCC5425823.1 hypothetical protein [Clostridium botulinum]MCC5437672.1 hypothetical protein [Clostridium botulinum]
MFKLTLDNFKKVRSIKMTDYFKIIKPTYTYLKITPDTSIRNYNSATIAKTIQTLHRTVTNRIHKEAKAWTYECPAKVSFYIYIEKNNVEFYFIVPSRYEQLMKEKISAVWGRATIETVEDVPQFDRNCLKHQLVYAKEDALSLNLDKKCNEPLNSIFNVLDIMHEGDKVGIFYNFIPTGQRSWRKEHDRTIQRIRENYPVDKEKFNFSYILKVTTNFILDMINELADAITEFLGGKIKPKTTLTEVAVTSLMLDDKKKLTTSTVNKKEATILNTQILVMSESNDLSNKRNNTIAVMNSFNTISNDNELIYKKAKTNFNPTDFTLKNIEVNKMSIDECQNFLELPGKDLLQKYSSVKKVDVLETEIPSQLQNGKKRLGNHTFKGKNQIAYFTTDKDYKNLAFVYVGPTRSGKTTALCNLSHDSLKAGECVVVLDFIENCGLSEGIKKYVPGEKILEIDLSNFKDLEGLGYNELDIETEEPLEQYNNAKLKTNQLEYLINSINDDSDLKARMERYLDAAAIVVFINNGPIKDVFQILQDHVLRYEYIHKIPEEQKENVEEYVLALQELDEWSKGNKDNTPEVIGTRISYVQGILNRVNKLKKNTVLELMLKKDTKNNINLADEIQKNKAIFIKMPENRFGTPEERDIITTYWLTKIWLALQMRAAKIPNRYDRTTVNIITDELNQLNSSQIFVGEKLSQCAKFGGKFIISTMYINELKIREKLRTANTSYILISGSDKTNYNELKEEFQQQGFTLEDLFNLKRHYSLNLIKYENGYWAGITKLPPPIE